MPEPAVARVERAMSKLTIGVVKDMREWEKQRTIDALAEVEEQLHIPFSGIAEEFPVWSTIWVTFNTIFVDATGQRDSPFDRPHFTYGARIFSEDPVAVNAVVMDWQVNDRNETRGAKLAIGVSSTDLPTRFRGNLHATFQGFGTPPAILPDDID